MSPDGPSICIYDKKSCLAIARQDFYIIRF